MEMFDFMSMVQDREERKVANFESKEGLIVDTCAVTDSAQPFETGISHPSYNDGAWVVVELYDTKKESQKGHKRWVKVMTAKKLPKVLLDVSTSGTASLVDAAADGKDWRKYKKVSK